MLRLIKQSAVALLLAVVGVAASSDGRVSAGLSNPYHAIYSKNIAGMAKPDKTLDDVADPSTPILDPTVELFSAQSKTCSQRCSTTCSTTCTTSRGCSSTCKVQTDGCGGTSVPRPSAPSGGTATVTPTPAPVESSVSAASGVEAGSVAALSFPPPSVGFFTLGSTEEQVRAAQGNPESVAMGGTLWFFRSSSVNFAQGRVVGYNNIDKNLKVDLKPRTKLVRADFGRGSSVDEVIAAQGTPASISVNGDLWFYNADSVTFRDGRVDGYSNARGTLKIRY